MVQTNMLRRTYWLKKITFLYPGLVPNTQVKLCGLERYQGCKFYHIKQSQSHSHYEKKNNRNDWSYSTEIKQFGHI